MDVRGTSNSKGVYPTGKGDLQKKTDASRGPKEPQTSASSPRMVSGRSSTKIPKSARSQKTFEAVDKSQVNANVNMELGQTATSISNRSSAEHAESASEVTSQATSARIIFVPDGDVFGKLEKHIGPSEAVLFGFTSKVKLDAIEKKVKDLTQAHEIFKKKSEQPLNIDDQYLRLGQEDLETLGSTREPWNTTWQDFASCAWLIGATINCGEDKLRAFFELAIAFREKGIDLPSQIVNHAIASNNHEFLKRLNDVYPNTNLKEYFLNNL